MEKLNVLGVVEKMKNKKTKITNECAQCGKQMSKAYGNKYISLPFCSHPECPNFRLLQTPITPKEFLNEEDKGEL